MRVGEPNQCRHRHLRSRHDLEPRKISTYVYIGKERECTEGGIQNKINYHVNILCLMSFFFKKKELKLRGDHCVGGRLFLLL